MAIDFTGSSAPLAAPGSVSPCSALMDVSELEMIDILRTALVSLRLLHRLPQPSPSELIELSTGGVEVGHAEPGPPVPRWRKGPGKPEQDSSTVGRDSLIAGHHLVRPRGRG